MQPGKVGMNAIQRRVIRASSGDTVAAQPFTPPGTHFGAVLLNAELEPISRRGGEVDLPAPEVETHIQSRFADQVMSACRRELLVACGATSSGRGVASE